MEALGKDDEDGHNPPHSSTYGNFNPRGYDLSWTSWWTPDNSAVVEQVDDEGEGPTYAVFPLSSFRLLERQPESVDNFNNLAPPDLVEGVDDLSSFAGTKRKGSPDPSPQAKRPKTEFSNGFSDDKLVSLAFFKYGHAIRCGVPDCTAVLHSSDLPAARKHFKLHMDVASKQRSPAGLQRKAHLELMKQNSDEQVVETIDMSLIDWGKDCQAADTRPCVWKNCERFVGKGQENRHLNKHCGVKFACPHKAHGCKKTFSCIWTLRRHLDNVCGASLSPRNSTQLLTNRDSLDKENVPIQH